MFKVFKTFFKFLTANRPIYAVFIASLVVADVMGNFPPYFYRLFVNAIPQHNFQTLLQILIFFTLLNVISLCISELAFWLQNMILTDTSALARETIFSKIQDLDMAFHAEKSTGTLISAFKRGDGAFFDIAFTFHQRLLDIFISFIVMTFFLVRLDVRIATITLTSMALTLIATRFLIELNVKRRKEFLNEEDNVSDIITDNLMNYETVKLFAREHYEKRRLSDAFIPWKKTLMAHSNTYRTIDFTIGAIINAGIFGMILFAIMQISNLKMGVGDFVLVISFIGMIFPRLWDLVWSFRDITRGYADIQKYFDILDFDAEVKDPTNPVKVNGLKGEIDFDCVYFTYKGRAKNAINGIDLKIHEGESVALVGRSGSGKTTLAKLLMRFYDLDSGKITIDGIDIKNFTKSNLRSFVGVVPQEPVLFNNTIAYNIGYGRDNPKTSDIKSAAKLANIDKFIDGLKDKYETQVGERGVKLSGGQKQRLAIARMILSNPDIVVFDEATSHLDSESEKLIQDAFWKARHGKTTIIIAHRLSTIMRADRIVVMEGGKIKETGTHEILLKDKGGLYSHFWNLQIKLD